MDRVAATMTPPCWTTTSRLITCRLIASRWRASKFSYDPDWSWPPSASPNLPDHGLQVYLQSCFITASKCISQFTQSRPRSASPRVLNDSLQLHLQTCSSTALKLMTEFTWSRSQTECPKTLDPSHQVRTSIALQVSSTLARLWPRSASLSSLTFGLQMHLQSCLLMASKFAQSCCGDTAELSWHWEGMHENEQFWLEEGRKWVGGHEVLSGHDELQKLPGSMTLQQAWVGPRAGKDRQYISYNEMMSMYPRVSQIYIPTCSVGLRYPSISVCPPPASPCQTEWQWWWETDFPATMGSKCISKCSQLPSPGAPSIMLEYHLLPD